MRKAKYSDIAILTRRTNHPKLEKMLSDRHIPVRKASGKGFFEAFEIRLALDLLKVIDNPYQDIPLAAVLLSPVAGLDADDLARIKIKSGEEPFCLYKACVSYSAQVEDETAGRLKDFLDQLCSWKNMALHLGFRRFLREILEESGLYNLCSAMTYGEGRRANLDYLNVLAENFLQGSYAGLFNFLRYLEAMQKADMDFGSSLSVSGTEDAVTMMTIHKSKGLEFPIVILADGGTQISNREIADSIYLDNTIGIGIEYRNVESRIRKKTLLMETIAAKKKTELFAEEIRLLYVAMSRAEEKLIVTGSGGRMQSRRKEWESGAVSVLPDAGSIRKNNSYLFLLADAMTCAGEADRDKFRWTIKDPEEIETDRAFEVFDEQVQRDKIGRMIEKSRSFAPDGQPAEDERKGVPKENALRSMREFMPMSIRICPQQGQI